MMITFLAIIGGIALVALIIVLIGLFWLSSLDWSK